MIVGLPGIPFSTAGTVAVRQTHTKVSPANIVLSFLGGKHPFLGYWAMPVYILALLTEYYHKSLLSPIGADNITKDGL